MERAAGDRPDVSTRVASGSDLPRAAETLGAAFAGDPLWSWAFPDQDTLTVWWRFLIEGALRHRHVFVAGDYAAVSVWIPPGARELTDEEEQRVEPLLEGLIGARASLVMKLLERFAAAHPKGRPHYYLSLLGTHPRHRGAGLGMALLSENLAGIDAEGMPAYLESSNPENVPRYERMGFERIGELSTPDGRHTVSTMWREG